jgi:hypothetical protein
VLALSGRNSDRPFSSNGFNGRIRNNKYLDRQIA